MAAADFWTRSRRRRSLRLFLAAGHPRKGDILPPDREWRARDRDRRVKTPRGQEALRRPDRGTLRSAASEEAAVRDAGLNDENLKKSETPF